MSEKDIQNALLEAVEIVVDSKLKNTNQTNSMIGVVVSDPIGFEVSVQMQGSVFTCTLPEHLHSWVQKDDIVIIQDLYSDGQKRIVTGKTGQLQSTPSLVFYSEEKDGLISGVDGIFDDYGNKITYGTVIKE